MGDRIAIWGAGRFGRYVYDQLKNRKDVDIRYFVDRNTDIAGKRIGEIDIFTPEQLQLDGGSAVDYVLISFLDGINTYDQLSKFKNIKFGIVKDRVFENELEFKHVLKEDNNIYWIADSNRPLLKTIETNVVDYCNLNCKGCSHFSNLYHIGDMIPFDTYCRDLTQLSQKVNLFRLNLLGGEALLNDKIIDYFRFSRSILPYTDICLVTNGLLLPKQKEEFFMCCIENNILVEVSEYLPTSHMKNQIISTLNQYEIMYKFREDIHEFMKNIDLSGKSNKYTAMKNCLQDGCNFFRNGKLYKCPFEALGNVFFEHFQFDIRLQGGVDIYSEEIDWKELIYNYEFEPVDACKYCGKGEWFSWEYSNSPTAEEWIVKNK